uniref:Regenerating islet-derived 3 gamma n=1 Tax=Nannospalax galili TaxID=1026970 RepID=A0A8C6QUI5_NANGA
MLPGMVLSRMSWMLLSCLMLLSQVQGEDTQKEAPSPRISCPMGSQAYGSYCYALFKIPKSWFDADVSKWPSGQPVFVLSAAEASFVSSLVKRSAISYQYVWIGLHDPTLLLLLRDHAKEFQHNADVMNYNWERNPSIASDPSYCGTMSYASGFLKWTDYYNKELPCVYKFKG